jgi:integrase
MLTNQLLSGNNAPNDGKGVLAMASRTKVWIWWNETDQRYQVKYRWEGKIITHQSWVIPGIGQKEIFTKGNLQAAKALKEFIEARSIPNQDGIVTFHPSQIKTGKAPSLYQFRKYAELWLKDYRLQAQTGDRNAEYVDSLERFDRLYWSPKLGNSDIREINEIVIKDYYLWLCSEFRHSKKYRQNIMDGLRKLISEAFRKNHLQEPEFPDYKEKRQDRKENVNWLLEDDQEAVLEHVPVIHRPIVMMMFYHGLRGIEARSLTWDCLDLRKGTVMIPTAKGGPARTILLEPGVIEAIQSLPRTLAHRYVFHHGGKPYAKTTLWKIIRRALDATGFKDMTPKDASRHSAPSQLLRRGMSTRQVQKILGHADIRTTERYTHCLVEDQARYQRNPKQKLNSFEGVLKDLSGRNNEK